MFQGNQKFEIVKNSMLDIQTQICAKLEEISGDKFITDTWQYNLGKGGGITKVVIGEVIEKGGVNFSALEGAMNEKIALKMKVKPHQKFFVTGVSLVIHPKNPFVPTVHMNVRYFELQDRFWFGGGSDLTPYYPYLDDIKHFHRTLKAISDLHDPSYYPKFKIWCDEYFYLKHRKETRGVGGIFFDYLDSDWDKNFAFTEAVGKSFNDSYVPIFLSRKQEHYTSKNIEFQQYRRGRYVEFNLLYDRGTLFGLETDGRVESILMSLPAVAAWKYNFKPEAGSAENELSKYLQPQDWLSL